MNINKYPRKYTELKVYNVSLLEEDNSRYPPPSVIVLKQWRWPSTYASAMEILSVCPQQNTGPLHGHKSVKNDAHKNPATLHSKNIESLLSDVADFLLASIERL